MVEVGASTKDIIVMRSSCADRRSKEVHHRARPNLSSFCGVGRCRNVARGGGRHEVLIMTYVLEITPQMCEVMIMERVILFDSRVAS